ncbi:sigma-70 family RNA polymerase sigma factor [Fulvivirgaceae bacterium PWU5]|uniref:Sigma-70 family RNA polymerase sigma factor n=1 Tax=Dawidia cretensis TaxID=2782350 RepID=A0AAP2DY95_9BACT|nr:sigma-70 family RNA polymerase sigma factor [Dawidia cretensis]MBT1708408.1 sigma-70 family RNA polymerase sigma factor [Dawidia cretensis]
MSLSEKERFIGILRDYRGILTKIIRSYCKNPDDWKDLEQEIVIQLWRALKNYDATYKLSTWVYRIALNVAISHYRQGLKRKNDAPLEEALFQVTADPAEELYTERRELLYGFITKLNEFDKAVIILYLEANSQKEIAEIMGISETNVSTRLHRIKTKLKSLFSTFNHV